MRKNIQFLLALHGIFFQYQQVELVLNASLIVLVTYVTITAGS
jgi:hypothetical protein